MYVCLCERSKDDDCEEYRTSLFINTTVFISVMIAHYGDLLVLSNSPLKLNARLVILVQTILGQKKSKESKTKINKPILHS